MLLFITFLFPEKQSDERASAGAFFPVGNPKKLHNYKRSHGAFFHITTGTGVDLSGKICDNTGRRTKGGSEVRSKHWWKYAGGAVLLLATVAFLLAVFYALSHTKVQDYLFLDTMSQPPGWRYEILLDGKVQEYEPEFADEYTPVFPDGAEAVRMRRILTEELSFAQLQWSSRMNGVEVFLGEELLHSDFLTDKRDENGFLTSAPEELMRIQDERRNDMLGRSVCVSLPDNYIGRELCMTTYFPANTSSPFPAYPTLCNDDTRLSVALVTNVETIFILTVYALFTLIIAVIFFIEIYNDKADYRILLLILYFALLFLDTAACSGTGNYGLFPKYLTQGSLNHLYIAPLYLYLAMQFPRRRKIMFSLWTVGWFLCTAALVMRNLQNGLWANTGFNGIGAFLLSLALGITCFIEILRSGKKQYFITLIMVSVFCLYRQAKVFDSITSYLFNVLYGIFSFSNYLPGVTLAANICAGMSIISLMVEFIRWTLRTNAEVSVLKEQKRLVLANYNLLLEANKASSSVRHEMRHHITALSGILDCGDVERARRYIASITSELNQLPVGYYSHNVLVNVIAGTYLNRAQTQGIRIQHCLNVPPGLPIADEDLSVFLNNMLQNAVEACERMNPEHRRYINIQMNLRENFLFIKCVNSTDDPPKDISRADEEQLRSGHGYGLAAMRKIAEKYGSMLMIEQLPGEFEIKSNLCLSRGAK